MIHGELVNGTTIVLPVEIVSAHGWIHTLNLLHHNNFCNLLHLNHLYDCMVLISSA